MRRKRQAFTLVELLIVIAILALLVGILMPSLNKAKAMAKRTKCLTNLHGVAVGMRMYLDNNDEIMPVAAQMPSLNLTTDPRIADVLAPYLSNPEVLHCPADTEKNYFESEGSSYEYHSMLGGRKVSDSFLTRRFGERYVPVMHDYETFHGEPNTPGAMNYLFADDHVGDLLD
jgi:prepilin-type N-terminal cleavage/methylation domain-containing protein